MSFSAQILVFGTGQMIKIWKAIKAVNTYEENYITSDLQEQIKPIQLHSLYTAEFHMHQQYALMNTLEIKTVFMKTTN